MRNKDERKAMKEAKKARKAAERAAEDRLLYEHPEIYAQYLLNKRLTIIQTTGAITAAIIGGACSIVAANKGIQASKVEAKAYQARIDNAAN